MSKFVIKQHGRYLKWVEWWEKPEFTSDEREAILYPTFQRAYDICKDHDLINEDGYTIERLDKWDYRGRYIIKLSERYYFTEVDKFSGEPTFMSSKRMAVQFPTFTSAYEVCKYYYLLEELDCTIERLEEWD